MGYGAYVCRKLLLRNGRREEGICDWIGTQCAERTEYETPAQNLMHNETRHTEINPQFCIRIFWGQSIADTSLLLLCCSKHRKPTFLTAFRCKRGGARMLLKKLLQLFKLQKVSSFHYILNLKKTKDDQNATPGNRKKGRWRKLTDLQQMQFNLRRKIALKRILSIKSCQATDQVHLHQSWSYRIDNKKERWPEKIKTKRNTESTQNQNQNF